MQKSGDNATAELDSSSSGMAPLPTTPEERKALAAYIKSLSK